MRKYAVIGEKYNHLTVVGDGGIDKWKKTLGVFKCDCGNNVTLSLSDVKRGHNQSCGCIQKIKVAESQRTHGKTGTPEYKAWATMKQRCFNPKNPRKKTYSQRGITVCTRWVSSFENFFEDMGERPSPEHSLERRDNDGNYEPSNCYWATELEQQKNTTRNVKLEYKGRVMIQAEWARELNTNPKYIEHHLKNGKNFNWIYEHFLNGGRKRKAA